MSGALKTATEENVGLNKNNRIVLWPSLLMTLRPAGSVILAQTQVDGVNAPLIKPPQIGQLTVRLFGRAKQWKSYSLDFGTT
jgi:hypothetical protein